jgi:hypothetical protein
MAANIDVFFESLAGKRIPGGCPKCSAEQVLEQAEPGRWLLVVAHEDDCAELRAQCAELN